MSEFNITINLDLNARAENKKRKQKRARKKTGRLQTGKQLDSKDQRPSGNRRRKGLEHGAAQNGALTRHPSAASSTQQGRCPPRRPAEPSQASTCSQAASVPAGGQALGLGVPSKCLAIDCEMVGTGPKGSISQLGRCSVVSYDGDVVYDRFVKPPVPVTDFRTRWSGIRPSNLANATPYSAARKEVKNCASGWISSLCP